MPNCSDQENRRAVILKDVLLNRRSVRQFEKQRLKREHIIDILESAIHAPSGSNSQNQRFLVIEEKQELDALGKVRFIWPYPTASKIQTIKPSGLIGGAAAAIVVFADAALTDARDNGEYYIWEYLEVQNCAASVENMLNMATALGIGSCWLSASENMTRTRLLSGKSWAHALAPYEIPECFKIQAIVIFGYPNNGLDVNGFPKGENKHGATFWNRTERKDVEHYLIKRRNSVTVGQAKMSLMDNIAILFISKVINVLLWAVHKLERSVYGIEVRKALAGYYKRLGKVGISKP